jgi:uncharacterized protein YoxC
MPTTKRPKTPAPAPQSAVESDYAPLYAMAGLTDVVATSVKDGLKHSSERAAKRMAELQSRPAQLEQQVKTNADELSRRIKAMPEQVKALPETTKARIVEMQRQIQAYLDEASHAYAELAGRGKRAVDDTIVTARSLSTKAEHKAEDVLKDVAEAVDPAFERVQETVTVARKNVTGRTATETVTSRSAARSSTARQVAAEKAAAEKLADERVAAERTAARRAAAKRGAATRAAGKKAAETP